MNVPREIIPAQDQGPRLFAVPAGNGRHCFNRQAGRRQAGFDQRRTQAGGCPWWIRSIWTSRRGRSVTEAWEKFFADARNEARRRQTFASSAPRKFEPSSYGSSASSRRSWQPSSSLKRRPRMLSIATSPTEAAKNQEEIIALIEAALRHDQAQPWMYEILAMSINRRRPAAGGNRPGHHVGAGVHAESADLMISRRVTWCRPNWTARRCKIFQQVSQIEPFLVRTLRPRHDGRPQAGRPSRTGMVHAGILGQAWLPAQAKMWDDAYRVAQAKLKALRDNKRNEEADHFQAAIDQALVRDCMVRVQWTGDADIDVMVKEPGGTICSLRNQRTTGGGMLVGDLSSPDGKESIEGHTAVYSCPKAISGEYQVLVRRVFGNVPTGHVKVIVDQHMFTPQAKQTVWEQDPRQGRRVAGKVHLGRRAAEGVGPRGADRQCRGGRGGNPAAAGGPRAAACRAERSAAGAGAGGCAAEMATASAASAQHSSRSTRWRSGPTTSAAQWATSPSLSSCRRHEHGRHGRRFGRPPLCPHHLCAGVLGHFQGYTFNISTGATSSQTGQTGSTGFSGTGSGFGGLGGNNGGGSGGLAVVLVAVALAAVAASSKPGVHQLGSLDKSRPSDVRSEGLFLFSPAIKAGPSRFHVTF